MFSEVWRLIKKEKLFLFWPVYEVFFNCVPITYFIYQFSIERMLNDGVFYVIPISLLGPIMCDKILENHKKERQKKKIAFSSANTCLWICGILICVLALSLYYNLRDARFCQVSICFFGVVVGFLMYLYDQMESFKDIVKQYGDKTYDEEEKERQARLAKIVQEQKRKKDDEGCEL